MLDFIKNIKDFRRTSRSSAESLAIAQPDFYVRDISIHGSPVGVLTVSHQTSLGRAITVATVSDNVQSAAGWRAGLMTQSEATDLARSLSDMPKGSPSDALAAAGFTLIRTD